eukprot:scaffold85871_cov16-Tisochrysis_lutea.AAC.1
MQGFEKDYNDNVRVRAKSLSLSLSLSHTLARTVPCSSRLDAHACAARPVCGVDTHKGRQPCRPKSGAASSPAPGSAPS